MQMMPPFYLPYLQTENKTQPQPNQQFCREKKKEPQYLYSPTKWVRKEEMSMLQTPFKAAQKTASSVSFSSWKEMSQQPPPFKFF